jgi:predicted TIM-barrel fold metal-dependent hydrolase
VTPAAPLVIVSGDGHVGPRTELYRPYVEPEYRDDFDAFLAGHHFRWTPEYEQGMFARDIRERYAGNPRYSIDLTAVLTDPHRRLAELDTDGVAAEMLFPDDQNRNTPPWLVGIAPRGMDQDYPVGLQVAGARAYNRWLAEFCSAAPNRLLGQIALGSLGDVDAAITELRRAHSSGLTSGVLLPLVYDLPLYHHPRYDPLWAACTELDLTVTVHAGDGGPKWYGEGTRAAMVYMAEMMFYAQRPLWCAIYGGVFERHPNLRMVFTEQGSYWVPQLLTMLDLFASIPSMRYYADDPLPRPPSETFRQHCVVANSLMQPSDVAMRDAIGVGQLAWGSDFPHFEGSWPVVGNVLPALMDGVGIDDARALLGGNLIRAYHLDPAPLEELAARIGPQTETLIGAAT